MHIAKTTISQTTVSVDQAMGISPMTEPSLRAEMAELGITIAGSNHFNYNSVPSTQTVPIIQLSADRWFVLDVDSAEGLGLFHRRLRQRQLPGLAAYVLTDKGVLLIYPKDQAGRADTDADVRYERMAQQRGAYAMHCLSKVDGSPRQMTAYHPDDKSDPASPGQRLAAAWNRLALQAASLGVWVDALKCSQL